MRIAEELMFCKILELHGAALGYGEAAGRNDECARAAIRGHRAEVWLLSQRGKPSFSLSPSSRLPSQA